MRNLRAPRDLSTGAEASSAATNLGQAHLHYQKHRLLLAMLMDVTLRLKDRVLFFSAMAAELVFLSFSHHMVSGVCPLTYLQSIRGTFAIRQALSQALHDWQQQAKLPVLR